MATAVMIACAPVRGADPVPPAHDESAHGNEIRLLVSQDLQTTLPGATRPARAVTLGASFDARLMELLVEEGAAVRKGDIIARLDARVVAASLELAREEAGHTARMERARAQLKRDLQILQRMKDAFERGGANAMEVDDAQTSVDLARAELDEALEIRAAAARRVQQAAARLEEHTIRAPFDGVVLRLATDEGAVLRTGDPIAELADVQTVTVDLYLPAETALSLELGALYALRLDAPIDRVVTAQARYIEPSIEPTSGAMRVVFEFDAPNGRLPAGLLVMPATRLPNAEELAFMAGADPERALTNVTEDAPLDH